MDLIMERGAEQQQQQQQRRPQLNEDFQKSREVLAGHDPEEPLMEPCLEPRWRGIFNQCDRCPTFSLCVCVSVCHRSLTRRLPMAAVVRAMVVMVVMRWLGGFWLIAPRVLPKILFGDGYSWVDNTDHVVIA